jgi:hypothetical protein
MSKQSDLLNLTDAISVSGTNVGIGTTSPSNFSGYTTLDVVNATNGGAILTRGSTVEARIVADQPTGVVQVKAQSNHPLTFGTSGTERMRIDTEGCVTMPYQPAFLVTPTSSQSNIAVGSEVTVVFGTEIFDQNADFASNQFTAPVTGRYQLNLTLYLNQIDTASDYYHIKLFTSNRLYSSVIDSGALASDAVYWNIPIAALADMDAGDIAKVTISQNNGTAQTDIVNETTFSGYLAC